MLKIFISFLFLIQVSFAQVAFVRSTQGSAVAAALTLSIEVSAGTDRMLVVGFGYKSNGVLVPDSISFNGGELFSVEDGGSDNADAQCLLYYLANPTVTTANVVIYMPSSVRCGGYVSLFTGINQSDPFTANTVKAGSSSNNPTVNISSSSAEICVSIMAEVSAGPETIDANSGTLICDQLAIGGGTDVRVGGQYEVGTGSRTMSFTMSDVEDWNIIAAALQIPSSGWTGKITGVTNPKEIKGTSVSNISKVNGQ